MGKSQKFRKRQKIKLINKFRNWEDPADWELEYETIIEEAKEHHRIGSRH